MDTSVGLVGVVLDVGGKFSSVGDGEDIAEAGVFVEGVGVDRVRGLLGGEEEDSSGVGVGVVGQGWEVCRQRSFWGELNTKNIRSPPME